jgi:hypothetical protein
MNPKRAVITLLFFIGTALGNAQTSPLYMISSPNVAYPVGTTYVYQNGNVIQSWGHVATYEIPLAVVGGKVRQGALYNAGTGYTLAGVPTGDVYPVVPDTYDATSDGNSIYGWNLVTATLARYDLNWNFQQNMFSLGTNYSYGFMGVTYDPQDNSIWLSPWSSGSLNLSGSLYHYSLGGQLLGTFSLSSTNENGNGLAYDPADNTLWLHNWGALRYEHYSKTGTLLGTLTGPGINRGYGAEFLMVPEPSTPALFGAAVLVVLLRRSRVSVLAWEYRKPKTRL